ncbi:hypothetical protein EV189_4024 [Motilibacter rhizosphaerae]|uniref:Uncharacterized protein n=1 Tax=Motilibacter rhizosphaerae TaxID=598652 RepID=A0A4Q7N757_9ACTN|nr:hypothetical protein [Motilibacter rhizosphaerae]RZS77543.1 hypothetical protein EV189_4024 [Motilibacter rhizosphaerae]
MNLTCMPEEDIPAVWEHEEPDGLRWRLHAGRHPDAEGAIQIFHTFGPADDPGWSGSGSVRPWPSESGALELDLYGTGSGAERVEYLLAWAPTQLGTAQVEYLDGTVEDAVTVCAPDLQLTVVVCRLSQERRLGDLLTAPAGAGLTRISLREVQQTRDFMLRTLTPAAEPPRQG